MDMDEFDKKFSKLILEFKKETGEKVIMEGDNFTKQFKQWLFKKEKTLIKSNK